MFISSACPTCGNQYKVPQERAGEQYRCRKCRHEFWVPIENMDLPDPSEFQTPEQLRQTEKNVPRQKPAGQPAFFVCSNCGDSYEIDGSLVGRAILCRSCNAAGEVPTESARTIPKRAEPKASSAAVRFACPGCDAVFTVGQDKAGTKIRCHRCGQRVAVPAPTESTLTGILLPKERVVKTDATPQLRHLERDDDIAGNDRRPILWGTLVAVLVVGVAALLYRQMGPRTDSAPQMAGRKLEPFNSRGGLPEWLPSQSAESPTVAKEPGAQEIYARVSPSVVVIGVFGQNKEFLGHGSGFVVADGLIATNHHVVRDAYFAQVVFPDGSRFEVAGTTAIDATADLALVRLTGTANASALELGSPPAVGSRVFAIGAPQRLANTITSGIVSGLRVLNGVQIVQTDATTSGGSSGGPLLSESGKVIGIVRGSWKDRNTNSGTPGLNLAVAASHLQQLIANQGSLRPLESTATPRPEAPRVSNQPETRPSQPSPRVETKPSQPEQPRTDPARAERERRLEEWKQAVAEQQRNNEFALSEIQGAIAALDNRIAPPFQARWATWTNDFRLGKLVGVSRDQLHRILVDMKFVELERIKALLQLAAAARLTVVQYCIQNRIALPEDYDAGEWGRLKIALAALDFRRIPPP